MIDHSHKNSTMAIECDSCGKATEFNGDFKYCITEARGKGWIVVKKLEKWLHYCSTKCKGKPWEHSH